jgi:hypothetical protein
MATSQEGVVKKLNVHWTLLDRNEGDNPFEENGVVIAFWCTKTVAWTKFMELEDVSCVVDMKGNPHLQVTRYPFL